MPLLDHFHPPLLRTHPWRSFHSAWASAMARLLNAGVLPPGYYALPSADHEKPFEIDVAALHDPSANGTPGATQPWAPPEPALSVAVEWSGWDDIGVEVHTDDGDPRLAAAIELVSPGNKDRATARDAFAHKCAEHLGRGCGVVVVDTVTTRHANLHAAVCAAVGAVPVPELPEALGAVAYRSLGGEADGQLLMWPHALTVGKALPTLPLWLGEFAVPLDLEASYTAACADLRIQQAG